MRNSTIISKGILESILDDNTIDDNSTSKSSEVIATNVLKNNNGRVVLEDGQTEWRYRLKITKYTMDYVRSEKEVEDDMKDIPICKNSLEHQYSSSTKASKNC